MKIYNQFLFDHWHGLQIRTSERMNTTGQMGVVTGYAASLCKKYRINPREIYPAHIDELKELIKDTGK